MTSIRVTFDAHAPMSWDTPVPVEVFDLNANRIGQKVIPLANSETIDVATPGLYYVRATLPSGEYLGTSVRVDPTNVIAQATLAPAVKSPRETLAWAYTQRGVGRAGRQRGMPSESARAADVAAASNFDITGVFRVAANGSRWSVRPDPAAKEIDRTVAQDDPCLVGQLALVRPAPLNPFGVPTSEWHHAFVRFDSWSSDNDKNRKSYTTFVGVPSGVGIVEQTSSVLFVNGEGTGGAPVHAIARGARQSAESLLAFLENGAVDAAQTVSQQVTTDAIQFLEMKKDDPFGAAIAGYYLLRMAKLDQLQWMNNLADWFIEVPDGAIVYAVGLLRSSSQPEQRRQAMSYLVEAARRGIPLYTTGLRLLFDHLRSFSREFSSDMAVKEALERVRSVAAYADWEAQTTTIVFPPENASRTVSPLPRGRRGPSSRGKNVLGTQANFRALSVKDLLEARDLYHYHLMSKPNVVGTAVGLYLIRKTDPWPDAGLARDNSSVTPRPARMLGNSEVRDYSWPCVLAFVSKWVDERDIHADSEELHPEGMVPKTLYMADGRMVPVCVVKVDPTSADAQPLIPDWHWPKTLYAPGMPIVVDAQGGEHRATVGCLVSDGHTLYALTSRHVTGGVDEPVYTMARNATVRIGRGTSRCMSRIPFEKAYPEFTSRRTFVNIDVGLIELDQASDWTSSVLGLGETAGLADLNQLNITTRLIDAPLVAAGAASGRMVGRIKALFYRYKSVGGFDYVADFLIAPQTDPDADPREDVHLMQTQRGDSGTVWHLVTEPDNRTGDDGAFRESEFDGDLCPLAVEWGGQVLAQNATCERFTFALATSLTTVCRALDVEVVTQHQSGPEPFWGQTGHYTIATYAIEQLPNGPLKTFLRRNADRISFETANLDAKTIAQKLKEARDEEQKTGKGFIPLADVPDLVWKKFKSQEGGRDTQVVSNGRTTGPEHPTHFADIDEPRTLNDEAATLRELSLANPTTNLTVEFWQTFYTSLRHTTFDKRGCLPFRIWQFYDAMKECLNKGDVVGFLCAAGVVAHYVGDACQPLHGSMLADGFPDGTGKGVHSTYESAMIDRKESAIRDGLNRLPPVGAPLPILTTGHAAALEVVRLMDRTANTIDPTALINAFVSAGGKDLAAVKDALWKKFGDKTIQVIADGARALAAIWQSAWDTTDGGNVAPSKLTHIRRDNLSDRYNDATFVPSLDLDHIKPVLK
jgi:hypothetical protein